MGVRKGCTERRNAHCLLHYYMHSGCQEVPLYFHQHDATRCVQPLIFPRSTTELMAEEHRGLRVTAASVLLECDPLLRTILLDTAKAVRDLFSSVTVCHESHEKIFGSMIDSTIFKHVDFPVRYVTPNGTNINTM